MYSARNVLAASPGSAACGCMRTHRHTHTWLVSLLYIHTCTRACGWCLLGNPPCRIVVLSLHPTLCPPSPFHLNVLGSLPLIVGKLSQRGPFGAGVGGRKLFFTDHSHHPEEEAVRRDFLCKCHTSEHPSLPASLWPIRSLRPLPGCLPGNSLGSTPAPLFCGACLSGDFLLGTG